MNSEDGEGGQRGIEENHASLVVDLMVRKGYPVVQPSHESHKNNFFKFTVISFGFILGLLLVCNLKIVSQWRITIDEDLKTVDQKLKASLIVPLLLHSNVTKNTAILNGTKIAVSSLEKAKNENTIRINNLYMMLEQVQFDLKTLKSENLILLDSMVNGNNEVVRTPKKEKL